jgi:predicted HTH transcriptional regulator
VYISTTSINRSRYDERVDNGMTSKEWTFFTNHGRILVYIARQPRTTAQQLAEKAGLSIRAVQNIIDDLATAGYIERHKEGRRNSYVVHPEIPMRHRLEQEHRVGDVLQALGYCESKQSTSVEGN